MVVIKYNKRHLYSPLILGIYLAIVGLIALFYTEWQSYGLILIGSMGLGIYLHRQLNQYITIDKNWFQINSVFPEKFDLRDIVRVSKFGDEYKISTKKKDIIIMTNIIDKKSLTDLEEYLKQL